MIHHRLLFFYVKLVLEKYGHWINPCYNFRFPCCLVTHPSPRILSYSLYFWCNIYPWFQNIVKEILRKFKLYFYFSFWQPQHGLPDIFVWMLSNNKRIAYTRIPAEDILFSRVQSEKGQNCGRVQTIFLRVIHIISKSCFSMFLYVTLFVNNK